MKRKITFAYCESILHEGELKKGLEPFCKANDIKLKLIEHMGPMSTTVFGEIYGEEDVLNYIMKKTVEWNHSFLASFE